MGESLLARNWFLRTPNPSNANNERNINTSGTLNNNNANNGNGASPDYISARMSKSVVKRGHLCKERFSQPRGEIWRACDGGNSFGRDTIL